MTDTPPGPPAPNPSAPLRSEDEGDSGAEAPPGIRHAKSVDPERVRALKEIIMELHRGGVPDAARARFSEVIGEVSPREIGAMEEELIRDGIPVEEIQRLCDLHLSVVRDGLDREEEPDSLPGHPVHTYQAENEIITGLANRLGELSRPPEEGTDPDPPRRQELLEVLNDLRGIDNHYSRKENELFPVLERHGVRGPSQVMWGVHDDIRAMLKRARALLDRGSEEEAGNAGLSLARALVEMVHKENKILLPLAMKTLSPEEWADVRRGEDELGYAFQEPLAPFPADESRSPESLPGPEGRGPSSTAGDGGVGSSPLPIVSPAPVAPLPERAGNGYVDLGTGRLSLMQVDMLLRHLPIEISFVDEGGIVRYYSETEDRLFPRTPGAIGRHVENCHPPKSIHMVKEILRKFAEGERDVAEFWIEMQGKFIHIRYFAVRNPSGEYLGCLEVTQDVSEIRALVGERRLLEWT